MSRLSASGNGSVRNSSRVIQRNFLSEHRFRSRPHRAPPEVQPHCFLVGRHVRWPAISAPISRIHVQFLTQFAREAGFVRFTGVALAAGKLPQARQVRVRKASRHENDAIALDHAGEDDDWPAQRARGARKGYDRHCDRIAQVAQSGLRAEHTVAPKSISAWLKS
jgi:hypothetical protein